uniref:C2H2-type domain-containing protein n=1 Tax=Anopheles christyi TaxID=43041 RepID=A0A182K1Z2_9DIPT
MAANATATAAACPSVADDDQDYQESDKTRASNPEDFPNFRDFQIVKMVQHFRVVTDGSQEQLRLGFKCKTCGITFNKTMQLLGHIRLHFEDEHTCRDCGKYFFDPNKLQIHIKAKHTINMLKCQLGCPRYSTPSFKCLQLHYERFHFVKIRMRELRKMDEAIRNGGTVMTQIISKKHRRKQLRSLDLLRSGSSGEDSQGAEGPYEAEEEEEEEDTEMQQEEEQAGEEEDAEEEQQLHQQPQTQQPQQQLQPQIQLQQIHIQQPQLIQHHHQLQPQQQQYVIQTVEPAAEEEDDGYEDDDDGSEKVMSETAEENALYDDQMQCCVCGAIFEEEQQLELHENSHTAPLECSFCSQTFMQLSDVREHYQQRHQAVSRPSQYVIAHPSGSLVQQQALHQIVHNPHQLQHEQQPHQQMQQTAQFIPSASNGAMTTMLVMQNGMLIPVHAIDSAQLTAVNPYQHQATTAPTLTPIAQSSQIAWPITATPIANAQHQQILPPVHNQIEIIPLHTSPTAPGGGGGAATPHHSIITSIATSPQQVQAQQAQTLTPIQLSIKDASGNVIGSGAAAQPNATGGYVINQIASIDPSYLKQIDPVLHHQQQQQQQQQTQQQQIHASWHTPSPQSQQFHS